MLMIMILSILLQKFYKLIYRQLLKKKIKKSNIYLLCFRHQIHSLLHQFIKVI